MVTYRAMHIQSKEYKQVKKSRSSQPLPARIRAGFVRRRTVFFTGAVVAVLSLAVYVGLDTWMTNNRLSLYGLRTPTASGQGLAVQSDASRQAQEGSDESDIPSSAVDNYIVAADLPRALYIDKISVKARVLPMGVNPDGTIQAPKNIFDSGWYTSSVRPGEPGVTFINAHASGATRYGLFAYLDKLSAGDIIRIEKGDGTQLRYKVTQVATVNKDSIKMSDLLKASDNTAHNLNLMTCTGKWIQDQNTYDKRVIVYSEEIIDQQ